MSNFSNFEKKYKGKRIDYDKAYAYQCVDLIKQWLHDYYKLSPGAWGNAIDYWTRTNPAILKKFNKIKHSYKEGDIVVFKGGKFGHISIASGWTDPIRIEVLDQNGGKGSSTGLGRDAIQRHKHPRYNVVGVLRPKATKKSIEVIAREVIAGRWGNGPNRIKRLIDAGYNPTAVQLIVNRLLR